MPRTLSSANAAGVAETRTRPLYLVDIGFSSTLRLSSRGDVTWDGVAYTGAGLEISLTPPTGSLRLWNEDLTYGATFLSEGGADIPITIYLAYGESPFALADVDTFYSGVIGSARIAKYITAELRPAAPIFTPRRVVADDVFSHLPPDGTELSTPAGTFILNRRD